MSQPLDSSSNGPNEIMLFGVRVKVYSSSNNNLNVTVPVSAGAVADPTHISAEDSSRAQPDGRKRGNPWTVDEHRLFLQGLLEAGKGDWKGISRSFVKTRTPQQIASHAQKYFLRQSNHAGRRRRSSVFDITTDSVQQVNGRQVLIVRPITAIPAANPSAGGMDQLDPPSTSGFNNGDDVITVN